MPWDRTKRAALFGLPWNLLRGVSPCASQPTNIKDGNSGPDGSWVPFLSGGGSQKRALRPLFLGSPRLWGRCLQASAKICQHLSLAGWGVFLAPPTPLTVDYSSSNPFPTVPQARLGAWPPVCWQDWGWGGGEATSNCPGKTSSLLTSLLSRRRGKRPGQAHPMPGSYPSPPSSPTLLFSPRPKQA